LRLRRSGADARGAHRPGARDGAGRHPAAARKLLGLRPARGRRAPRRRAHPAHGHGRSRRRRAPAHVRRDAGGGAGATPGGRLRPGAVVGTGAPEMGRIETREVAFAGAFAPTAVYARHRLAAEAVVRGPALVEEPGTTTVVPPGFRAWPDIHGNLVLEAGR